MGKMTGIVGEKHYAAGVDGNYRLLRRVRYCVMY